jgi:HSP20 family protein
MRRNGDFFDMQDFFESLWNDSFSPAFFNSSRQMKVDIKENDDAYVLDAELPGVDKNEINLEIHDDILTISVNRREEVKEERANYIRRERRTNSMSRSFQLENIKNEDITAKFENGILSIHLPKKEPGRVKTKKIDIN